MSDLSKIVYLSAAQYETLKTNGTITVDGTTINYSNDDLYLTPDTTVPTGGTSGQVLTKASSSDYDTVWVTPTEYAAKDASNLSSANISSWSSTLGVDKKLLWTNPDDTQVFSSGNITVLSQADYDTLLIIFKRAIGDAKYDSAIVKKGDGFQMTTCQSGGADIGATIAIRSGSYVDNTTLQIGDCRVAYGTTAGYTNNEFCIPKYVIGIKTNLFS